MPRLRWLGGASVPPVGLDIGRHSIKLTQVEQLQQSCRVVAAAHTPTPASAFDDSGCLVDAAALAGHLSWFWSTLELGTRRVVTAVGGPPVAVRSVEVYEPLGPPPAALAADWGAELPFDAGEAVVSEAPLSPRDDAPWAALAVAVRRVHLVALVEALELAGLRAARIDAAPFAAAHALVAHDPGAASRRLLIGDLGATHTTWTQMDHGDVRWSEIVTPGAAAADGLGWTPVENGRVDAEPYADVHDAEPPSGYVEAVLGSLAEAFARHSEQAEGADEVVLHGGGALARGVVHAIEQSLGLPARAADVFSALDGAATVDLPDETRAAQPLFATSLGLAWRAGERGS
ncbi:MAG: pilus assembly protein PilM [Armatimonadetes bacterium]|nr:pilus assembly protein PilM [Armatimonadota bacterium]